MENVVSKDLHLGIYGLLEQGESILLIRKSRGPYKGLFDLPGGRPHHGEPLFEALRREIKEETGIETDSFSLFGNFSFLIPYQDSHGNQKELYHIALVYRVNKTDFASFNPKIVDEDVSGSLWIRWDELRKENCSLLLRKVRETYEK